MSWGERSCKHSWNKNKTVDCRPEMNTCNVNCPLYEWDGKTPPDSATLGDEILKGSEHPRENERRG